MKTKRFLSLVLAIVMIAGFATVPAFGAAEPTEEEIAKAAAIETLVEDHNFTEIEEDESLKLKGVASNKKAIDEDGSTITGVTGDYYLDLVAEKIYVANTNIADGEITLKAPAKFISYDGGNKWSSVSIGVDGLDISASLKKETNIILTSNLDTTVKPNVPKEGANATGSGDSVVAAVNGSVTYTFPKLNARPKLAKFKPDFLTYADKTGTTNGQWSAPSDVDTSKLNISLADSTGKKAALDTWFNFPAKTDKAGINVQGFDSKPGKVTYVVRLAPTKDTPASAPMKLAVPTIGKATNFKIDYKKELVKVKADTIWAYAEDFGGWVDAEGEKCENSEHTNETTHTAGGCAYVADWGFDNAGDATSSPIANAKGEITPISKDDAKNGIALTVDKKYDLYGEKIAVRIQATEKKPASAVQFITVADRTQLFQVDFKPSFAKGKMTYDKKTYEFWDEGKGKWGGAPKEAGTYKVRVKNSAKYDAKGDKTTGNVSSAFMEVTLVSGSFDAKKPDKMGLVGYTVKSFPKYEGLIWAENTTKVDSKAVSAVSFAEKDWKSEATEIAVFKFTLNEWADGAAVTTADIAITADDIEIVSDIPETGAIITATATVADGVVTVTVKSNASAVFEAGVYTISIAPKALADGAEDDGILRNKFTCPSVTVELVAAPVATVTYKAVKDSTGVATADDLAAVVFSASASGPAPEEAKQEIEDIAFKVAIPQNVQGDEAGDPTATYTITKVEYKVGSAAAKTLMISGDVYTVPKAEIKGNVTITVTLKRVNGTKT